MTTRRSRLFVRSFIALLAVFGFGQLEAWPFTSWDMFSRAEPAINRVAIVIAVDRDGGERRLGSGSLPLGLLGHPLRTRLQGARVRERAKLCASLLAAARSTGDVIEVRVEERSWDVLIRAGDRPANVTTRILAVCR